MLPMLDTPILPPGVVLEMSTFIIAEAGSTHDNSIIRAYDLINAAQAAGADACKFQFWSDPVALAVRRNAQDYLNVYQTYQVPVEWLDKLWVECEGWDIEFMCTVYLPEDIPVIAPYVKRFKVASFEAGDRAFINAHRPFKKPLIISTGMQTGEPIPGMKPWTYGDTFLHCVSAYPTPINQANLRALHGMNGDSELFGYSDHTHDTLTGALAVAAGARILEVHFRLNDTDPANPDYATALSPGQLKDYISLVRKAELMMGDGVKRPQPAEAEMMKYRVKA